MGSEIVLDIVRLELMTHYPEAAVWYHLIVALQAAMI